MDNRNSSISRRSFLAGSAAAVAAAGIPDWFAAEAAAADMERGARRKRFGPNDQINVGVIGPGGSKGGYRQGLHDTRNIASKPGVKVVAACDVEDLHLSEAAETFGPDCKKYHDFRDLLARKDIDAVVIGTPDHWHAYICIAAMKAGKDVYCEKPLTLTIDEGKKIVRVWRDTGAVFQTGSQQRSDDRFRLACELVRNGLVTWTGGNVSGRVPGADVFVIKPSGVSYAELSPENMIVCDLHGVVIPGTPGSEREPSSDTAAHAYVYRHMAHVGGVVHTHSRWATSFAQAGRGIAALGTTHADYFHGEIPCTRRMTAAEIQGEYETETGQPFTFTFLVAEDNTNLAIGQTFTSTFQEAGMQVTLEQKPQINLLAGVAVGQYQMSQFRVFASPNPDADVHFYRSPPPGASISLNFPRYVNPEVDAAIAAHGGH